MTRFVMTLAQSVDLVFHAINYAENGDIVIPKLISCQIKDLIDIFSEIYQKPVVIDKLRPGEKMLESLINPTQAARIVQKQSYYHIKSIFYFKETIESEKLIDYNSKTNPLSKEELYNYLNERNLL